MGSVDERFLAEFSRREWLAVQDALEKATSADSRSALKTVQTALRCPSLAELGKEFGGL